MVLANEHREVLVRIKRSVRMHNATLAIAYFSTGLAIEDGWPLSERVSHRLLQAHGTVGEEVRTEWFSRDFDGERVGCRIGGWRQLVNDRVLAKLRHIVAALTVFSTRRKAHSNYDDAVSHVQCVVLVRQSMIRYTDLQAHEVVGLRLPAPAWGISVDQPNFLFVLS